MKVAIEVNHWTGEHRKYPVPVLPTPWMLVPNDPATGRPYRPCDVCRSNIGPNDPRLRRITVSHWSDQDGNHRGCYVMEIHVHCGCEDRYVDDDVNASDTCHLFGELRVGSSEVSEGLLIP